MNDHIQSAANTAMCLWEALLDERERQRRDSLTAPLSIAVAFLKLQGYAETRWQIAGFGEIVDKVYADLDPNGELDMAFDWDFCPWVVTQMVTGWKEKRQPNLDLPDDLLDRARAAFLK